MSLENIVRSVSGRLSLREPQAESLRRLHWAVDQVPALRDSKARSPEELKAMQDALSVQFPTLTDFERDFPSLCFALATGVGKTRLMGAFISYLHAAYGYNHFFVLAPNLTIYDKLIGDFSPNSPKYVFKGIAEFASTSPEVITGDNYEQRGGLSLLGGIEVNIFNISKINSEVRGGKSPKIKRLSEYLGQSYFEYLAGLDDLVLIMDESHRYRASAGIRSLNELRPLLGLELTATPFVEGTGGRTTPFKNVVMDYPLARAIEDGFVKEPAVVTQQNFDPKAHSAGALETIKLQDGVRVHEETKVHLLTYAQQTGEKLVKPFMLVIARDTTHAAALMATIESNEFFAGRYKGKVIQVDSSRSGAEEEEMIRRLLAVESYDEPTEIVIHVNMLKEGWDVTNLYTIVPLRAANARTLIEQSIGRGLRLPYGRKTGVDAVDRLNIIAHDRFQEVIDEAGRGDSPIRMQTLVLTPDHGGGSSLKSISVQPTANAMLGTCTTGTQQMPNANFGNAAGGAQYGTSAPTTVFNTDEQRQIAQVAMDVIAEISREREPGPSGQPLVPSTQALTQASIQQQITQRVQQRMVPKQGDLLTGTEISPVADIVQKTVAVLVEHTIDIPRISVVPKGPVTSGYKVFTLDLSKMNFQPQDMALVGQGLKTGKQVLYGQSSTVLESQLENYIVRELINYDDVSYDEHAELIYALSGQAVAHFNGYLKTEDELHNILGNYGKNIAENIHLQMALHYYEDVSESEVVISQGFTPLKPCAFTAEGDILPLHQAPDEKGKIAQYVYGGFSKCAYPVQKFHSDTERVLACVLERDAQRWFRPVAGQFNIYYRSGANQPEYVPDFVATTANHNLIVETKAAKDMEANDVKAKAEAAVTWCKHASEFSRAQSGKPWKYLLIPHDAVAHNATVAALLGRFVM